ncbi:hypothetical protein [Candidatus Marithrix sp. Canyon 246]|uniref:hypothetical protein n=1 Tax=Candidatus Marithrix sp. Canyon 246 TaxID=1827136 RepID=UPI000849F1B6|nr:hypothetical protein [Candidatus Marithrix sp. Canyon 246]
MKLSIISYIPLFLVMLIVYYIMTLAGVDFNAADKLFEISLPSGAEWALTSSNLFILFCVIVLFIEIIKSTRTGAGAIAENSLSILVFVVCLMLFMLYKPAGTSIFLIMTLMSLLDSIAGFTITVIASRRDLNLNG